MANEGPSPANRAAGFAVRMLAGLLQPTWGVVMIVLGIMAGAGWWVATGVVVLAIGVVLMAGSSLITPFLGGRPLS